ncbi:MAG: MFS transporter [Gammaproteobacteria bacterium]|nr:MFS transporter [Gammaproteobacteria bacterium]
MPSASTNSRVQPSPIRALASVAVFGFASGLPLALTGSTLQAWLTQAGISVETIGALSLVGLPYLLKFLWAPLLDRYPLSRWSRRRGWVVLTQVLLVLLISGLALSDPNAQSLRIAVLVLSLAVVSATQDIAVDAYRAEVLAPAQRGVGAGISVAGYRLAMIVSGAGLLVGAEHFGFARGFEGIALLTAMLLVWTFIAPEPNLGTMNPRTLTDAYSSQLWTLAKIPGITGFVALIVLYKLGDAFAGSLTMTFLLRGPGFSLTEIGTIYKALGVGASIVGGIAGGWWMMRLGLFRALLWFGVLQAATNLGFLVLATFDKSLLTMSVVVALENLSGGMGTSALLAFLMNLCDRRYTATHFAVLSALASLARVLSGPVAGQVATLGWGPFFVCSIVLSLPGLLVLIAIRESITARDQSA